jgi:hypothetical protein
VDTRTELRCPNHLHAAADERFIIVRCARCTKRAERTGTVNGLPWDGTPIYHRWDRWTLRPIDGDDQTPSRTSITLSPKVTSEKSNASTATS